jgi:hypothetical protein
MHGLPGAANEFLQKWGRLNACRKVQEIFEQIGDFLFIWTIS